jgi:putative DNA primase/helicase
VQHAFFDQLEQVSDGALIPDRALSRPAQLVYLPNKGAFYQQLIQKGAGLLDLTDDHKIIRHRDAVRETRTQAEAETKTARERRMAKIQVGDSSTVSHFNAAHSITDLLARYGYQQAGSSKSWKSPFQSSGSYATRDCGDYWISLSTSDDVAEIGAATKNGHRFGDAFDLFRHFEHGGNFDAAVHAFALEAGLAAPPVRGQHRAARLERPQKPEPDAPEPRSYDDLMEAAQALEPGQIDDMEAIVMESAGLNPVRRDAIQRAIKDATKVTLTTLRDQLSHGSGTADPDHLDLARNVLSGIGRENIICSDASVWQWSDAGVWRQQDDRAIKQATQNVIDTEGVDVTASLVNGVTDVLKSEIFQPRHQFNRGNPEAVNCLNGEVEFQEGRWIVRPHCRENYRTTQIPVKYDRDADAPLFRAFMDQVFQDDADKADKIKSTLELIGYTLMSHARHEKFVMLIGAGANGKSVLLAVLEGLLGPENVAGVQPSNFENRFQRAHLHQKLANIVTELKQGEVIADAELKAITSGEPATVEHKFKNPFVMRPFATCWFGTNHMPHTRDFSEALFRRATILQFNRTFALHEQDSLLKGKLLMELSGILNRALDAYANAMAEGFTQPQSSETAKKEWRLEADQVAQFIDDTCQRLEVARTPVADVFRAYQSWAQDNGIAKTMSLRGLRERLTRLGFGADRDRTTRYVTGLKVTTIAYGA